MAELLSDIMEAGWNRMQAEGVEQITGSIIDYTYVDGKTVEVTGACALGAVLFGKNKEREYIRHPFFIGEVAPQLTDIIEVEERRAELEEYVWNMNDGHWLLPGMAFSTHMHKGQEDMPYTPIPKVIEWLRRQGR